MLYKPFRVDRLMEAVDRLSGPIIPTEVRTPKITIPPRFTVLPARYPTRQSRAHPDPQPPSPPHSLQRVSASADYSQSHRHVTDENHKPLDILNLTRLRPMNFDSALACHPRRSPCRPQLATLYHFILLVNVTSGLGFRRTARPTDCVTSCRAHLLQPSFCSAMHIQTPWWQWPWPIGGYAFFMYSIRHIDSGRLHRWQPAAGSGRVECHGRTQRSI